MCRWIRRARRAQGADVPLGMVDDALAQGAHPMPFEARGVAGLERVHPGHGVKAEALQ